MTFEPDDDDAHSTLVGGSTASRRIHCPGSYAMEQRLPAQLKDQSSAYADEGSALHSAMEFILRENITDLDEILGQEFGAYVLTDDLLAPLAACTDFVNALFDELAAEDGDEPEFELERKCQMPGIPGAFGTSDFIGKTPKRSIILDWKFGVGVEVKAAYERDDGVLEPNDQLMFYARAAMHTVPDLFEKDKDWPVDLYIVQPRLREVGFTFSKASTTVGKLEEWRNRLVRAIAEAKSQNATTQRGEWCRFASCKAICPHFTGPTLDLTKLRVKAKEGNLELTGDTLGLMLDLADIAELCIAEIRAVAHGLMNNGFEVTDYKLVDKRASEKYVDEKGAVRHVIAAGADPADCLEPAVTKSPAQLREVLAPFMPGSTKKAKTEAAKEEIAAFTQKLSSGTTIAHVDDKRKAVIPTSSQLNMIATKLAKLLPAPKPTEKA